MVDLPGFDDSDYLHNIENDISTSLGIYSLFKSCRSVKIVVLIDCRVLDSEKGKSFKEILMLVKKLLKNFD